MNNAVAFHENETLKHALLRGAGLPVDTIVADLTPELMELLGKLLASSVQGAIDLLAQRTLVRQEAHADLTMVVVRNNNPLKFFPDSATVLTQMLRKKMPGFMEPVEALDDAWRDLRAHQAGVVAGARASIDTVLDLLSPARVTAALPPGGLFDQVLTSRRPAASWAHYQLQFAQVTRDARDPFHGVLGASFLKAYEANIDAEAQAAYDAAPPRNVAHG